MSLPSELISVVAGALAVLVGSTLAFGHRYADKSSKFDEKSQSDELNEIRMEMRSDVTVLAIDRLWRFLVEVNQKVNPKMKRDGLMDVSLLLYDVDQRERFNKLLNDLEKTFKESVNIKEAWVALRFNYGRLGKIFYAYAAMVGLIGFPLLCLSSQTVAFLSTEHITLLWILLAVLGVLFWGPITYVYRKITSNMMIYQEKRKQYLDGVKIVK